MEESRPIFTEGIHNFLNSALFFTSIVQVIQHLDWLQGEDLNSRPPDNESDELPDCSTLPLFARLKGLQPFRNSPSESILHLRLSDDILRNCYERLDTLCRHQRIGNRSNLAIRFFSPTNIGVSCRTSTFALELKNRRGIQLLAARTIPVYFYIEVTLDNYMEMDCPPTSGLPRL